MSATIDVGDAFELTFNSATGADVEASWIDPDSVPVFQDVSVAESPAGSGRFPYTFLPDAPGPWRAEFRASGTATAFEQYWVRALTITGPAPLAMLGDVAGQFGTMTTAQEQLTGVLLRVASALVRSRFPVDAKVSAGRLDPEVVAAGVTNMVLRVLRNPRGLRSEAIGPFSRAFDTTAAAGLLVITEEDGKNFVPAPISSFSPPGSARMSTPGLAPGRSCWPGIYGTGGSL